jgi:hypothetical protein
MLRLALALTLAALPALAQDRQGRDTAGDWIVTHYQPFGLWDSICDERSEGAGLHRRCYLRYVDVFSPHPAFAAHFVFVTPDGPGVRIEYGAEPGTRFAPGGHRIERDGAAVWTPADDACLAGGRCVIAGAGAEQLYRTLRGGGAWRFDFTDRHGRAQSLAWDLTPFATAAADFEAETARRGLR